MTAIEKVSMLFERYAKVPLATSAKGEPLLLVPDDFNAKLIVAQMRELYGEQWSLQGIVDFVRNLTFAKQLHFIIQPGHEATAPPTAPSAPAAPRDNRTKTQRLQDSGIMPITYKKTAEDVVADKARRAADREKMKALFASSPERAELDRKLHDVNVYIEIVNGRINRATTNRAKEQMRIELRKQYPQFSELLKQPESERDVRF